MPRKKVVPLDRLSSEIQVILKEYYGDVSESVKSTVRKVAQKGAKAVRAEAKSKFKGKKYHKSWTFKFTTLTKGADYSATIYSKKYYPLAHLLEFGHVGRNGTDRTWSVSGRSHIEPVQRMVDEELLQGIKRDI